MAMFRSETLAPLSGIGFVLFAVVGAVVIGNYDYLPSAATTEAFFADHAARATVGASLGMVSAPFLIWFAGSLRSSVRRAEGGTGRLAAVAFGGGVTAAAMFLLGWAAMLTAAQRAGAAGGITPTSALVLLDLSANVVGQGAAIAFAAMTGAVAVVAFRARLFPAWFGLISAVTAVGLLIIPISYIFLGVAVLWIVIVSLWLTLRERSTEAPSG